MISPRDIETFFEEIKDLYMPFGRYGPKAFPPKGKLVYQLPYEYLAYFARKGFPKGKLGELMEAIYHIKESGASDVFFDFHRKKIQNKL